MSLAALERQRRAGVDALVAFAAGRERNLALAVELKAAVVEHALQVHVRKHPATSCSSLSPCRSKAGFDGFGHG
jgi:hypothetical protein